MGVYVYRSLRAGYIKVGHYAGKNAWSRVAHRGFYSCKRPASLTQVSVEDVDLVAWFPHLTKLDERAIKKKWRVDRQGTEWYPVSLQEAILSFLGQRDNDEHGACSKEEALVSRRRI